MGAGGGGSCVRRGEMTLQTDAFFILFCITSTTTDPYTKRRWSGKVGEREGGKERDRDRDTGTQRYRGRGRHRDSERHRQTDTDRQTDRQTNRQTDICFLGFFFV